MSDVNPADVHAHFAATAEKVIQNFNNRQADAPAPAQPSSSLDLGSIAKNFCSVWKSAGATLDMLAGMWFVGKYVVPIQAVYKTADHFFVGPFCASQK